MNASQSFSRARHRPSLSVGRGVALIISTIAISLLGAPSGAMASSSSPSAVLTVSSANGKAVELLHRLTLPQLAGVLKTTPAELKAQIEGLNLLVGLELGELLNNPKATVEEVLNLLSAHGVNTAPVAQLINRQLGGVTESGEQLLTTVDQVLADLRADGQIEQLAKELALPTAAVEALQLAPTTGERLASSLGTTNNNLARTLLGAGAGGQSGSSPFVAGTVPGTGSVIVGAPNGSGGLSLTVVNSTSPGPSAAAASGAPVSTAFTILSISVTKAGLVRETVSLPGPGRLAVSASTRRKFAFRSRTGRRRTTTRTATLASLGETLPSGVHTVTFRLKGAAARARPLTVKLTSTYTPTGGSPSTIQRSVTIGSTAKKRRR
jgi:hypothetical protein